MSHRLVAGVLSQLLTGRWASLMMDSDRTGREAATRIAGDLRPAGVHGSIIDLAPGRDDGHDLTEWLSERRDWLVDRIRAVLGRRGADASSAA